MEDGFFRYQVARAIQMALQVAPMPQEKEEVIDTTDPDFVKHFKGFVTMPGPTPASPQGLAGKNTQILFG